MGEQRREGVKSRGMPPRRCRASLVGQSKYLTSSHFLGPKVFDKTAAPVGKGRIFLEKPLDNLGLEFGRRGKDLGTWDVM